MNTVWTPPVEYKDLEQIINELGETEFVALTRERMQDVTSFALRNLNGHIFHPHVFISQKDHRLEIRCYITEKARVAAHDGRMWTTPLVLFKGEHLDMKDAEGNWSFTRTLCSETFLAWFEENVRKAEDVPSL